MKITCKTQQQIPASTQVKRIGKYLYKNLESAYNFKSSSNMFDVYFTLYYQEKHPTLGIAINGIKEMNIDINITTYQNKVRVDIIEMTSAERTLGYNLYPTEKLNDLPSAMKLIWRNIVNKVSKAYADYEFIF